MQTAPQKTPQQTKYMTIEEYLVYDDGTDTRYELVNGLLVEMPLENQLNATIARFLLFELAKHVPAERLTHKDTEIEVSGRRAKCRIPDLMVHSEESLAALQGAKQAVILRDMPPPDLIVEVVSPGRENRDRDYRYKRTEYAARGVAEYWILDPEMQQLTVCQWVNGQYEDTIYADETPIRSAVLPSLN
ncbi:MAG: Uma2 family endonuclease, partial [Cyanobacteria bacterium J06628_6]